jgi:hypothetical protein
MVRLEPEMFATCNTLMMQELHTFKGRFFFIIIIIIAINNNTSIVVYCINRGNTDKAFAQDYKVLIGRQ